MNTNVWGDFQICISVPLSKLINFYTPLKSSVNQGFLMISRAQKLINLLKFAQC